MKKIALFFLLACSFLGFSQVKGSQSLKWTAPSPYADNGATLLLPKFDAAHFSFDGTRLFFSLNIPTTSPVNENTLLISDIVYETISTSDLGQLPLSGIGTSPKATAYSTKARDRYFATISLNPIIKDGAGYKRILSFSYTLKEGAASVSTRRDFTSLSSSVLKSGDWYRFYVEKSGVYKISKSFLQSLGMKLNNINPNSIHIYGNGGRMLPLPNDVEYPSDLAENAIYIEGGNDGSFDGQDYILFYAEGMDNWSNENQTHNNLYADRAYYYVTLQGADGKRIAPMPDLSASPLPVTPITAFDDYQFHELDLVNIAKLGRKWFGEDFSVDSKKTFDFEFPNFVAGSQVSIQATGAVVAYTPTSLAVKANGTDVGAINFGALVVNGAQGLDGSMNGTFPAAASVSIEMEYNNNGVPGSRAYLDYIILRAKSSLKGYGKQFRFTYDAASSSSGIGEYQLTNAATISQVWDITDIYNVTAAANTGLAAAFSFRSQLGVERKFIAVDKNDYFSPKKESQSKVANQDLKGTIFQNTQGQFQDIDYLIITPASLSSAAEKLAAFHRSYSGLNVKVVNLETIYPEFSSGKQDIGAIRNFVKYVYNNASDPSKKVRYLNLFGDASYDFKNRVPNNTNLVPIWHALQSFSLSTSYISDDFFVLMDDNEGSMANSASNGLDIAVGRMPVGDIAKANEMVNKVVEYLDIKSYGRWRNNFVLISDDVDSPYEYDLENGLDQLGDEIYSQKPFINVEKIHSDSYVQEASAGGERYPKVNEDIISTMNQGALVFNYFGHGGEEGLATERIFDKNDINLLNNRYKYPLFITITCEFTRFDNPTRTSAGEELYWRSDAGAISLITTTRQIDITTGKQINEAFAGNLFGYGTNVPDSIAEELRISKATNNINTFMVFYIGDPALRLAIPRPTIVLTKVNDAPVTGPIDDLKALGTVKLSGEIRDETGNVLLSDYKGEVFVNVFDKEVERKTLGNPGANVSPGEFVMNFNTLGETLFRGGATVNNGTFDISFVMPRDTRIPVGNGRVSFYAKKTAQLLDQTGYNSIIKVGGINQSAAEDKTPPTVKLYMNDESFVSGGITNESPILLAILQDEHGINTASGIGHDIVAILDGDEANPYILNDYYDADADDFTKGRLKFPFRDIAKGLHTLTFKAWDVYNNLVTAEIQFLVVGDDTLTLKNVLNYPNPFVSYTQFWFTHNKPFEPLEVQVQVMTITGKVVWTKNQTVVNDGFLSRDITWDGKDDFGDRIGKGVYVYKLTVRSTLSNKRSEKFEKLVIL